MWPSLIFGSFLIVLSIALVVSHWVARSSHETAALDPHERTYRRVQFRRRMQASVLIGAVGLAIIGGLWVDEPPGEALYWCGVLSAVVWIIFLAGSDAASTQSFFREFQKQRIEEEELLRKEIDRYRRHEGNGKN